MTIEERNNETALLQEKANRICTDILKRMPKTKRLHLLWSISPFLMTIGIFIGFFNSIVSVFVFLLAFGFYTILCKIIVPDVIHNICPKEDCKIEPYVKEAVKFVPEFFFHTNLVIWLVLITIQFICFYFKN